MVVNTFLVETRHGARVPLPITKIEAEVPAPTFRSRRSEPVFGAAICDPWAALDAAQPVVPAQGVNAGYSIALTVTFLTTASTSGAGSSKPFASG